MKKILILLFFAALLGGIAYWALSEDRSSAAPLTTSDFAIADTAAIGKVDISDAEGNRAIISRGEDDIWMVNDKYRARKDAIDLILKTLHLIEIKHPVSAGSRENIIRMMAGRHNYVRIYDREGNFIKALYVGIMTPDQQGTYMVLERPEIGRTEIPYVMTMKTFFGYLSSRFFTDEKDWRDRALIRFPELEFKRVEIKNHLYPERSFAVEYGGGNDLRMYDLPQNERITQFDTLAIKDFLLLFKSASCETYELAYTEHEQDSILAQSPSFEIIVEANDPERDVHLKLFLRPAPEGQLMDDNSPAIYGREIMYGTLDGEELVRIQRYVFDHLLPPKQAFTGELDF